ncbi:MAG: START domain-containing protein [Bacteroidota bacterium]
MRYLIVILLFSFTYIPIQAQKDWKLEKTKGAIKAYIKDSGKAYKMYKIVCTIKAPIDKVIKKYADVASHSAWMSDIQKSELKAGTNPNELVSYYEIKLPWPMENRDAVYKLTRSYDAATQTTYFRFKAAPDLYPAKKGFVRIKISEGYWSFKKIDDKTTQVETSSYTETDGIPAWMVNSFIIDGPIKTFENFTKLLE